MNCSRGPTLSRWACFIAAVLLVLAGCGGGGGGGGSSTPSSPSPPASAASNVLPIVVDGGPAAYTAGPYVNGAYVSVKICTPGSTTCQTIDHVLLDTGSTGLRIMSSVITSPVLTQQNIGASPLAECVQFADGSYIWGPVKAADVILGGEPAVASLAIQVIGDPGFTSVPKSCSSGGGQAQSSVALFGANGILGLSAFQQDCGLACAQAPVAATYYSCAGTCTSVAVGTSSQVQNPVGRLAGDNNGMLIQLPVIGSAGAATASGSLILGIGTQSNNALVNLQGGAVVALGLDPNYGTLTTAYKTKSYSSSFFDSGSNGIFFPDATIPVCSSGFYCPPSTLSLTATNQGTNGNSSSVNFSVANANTLQANTSLVAFSNLAGSSLGSPSFDWGLPFYYGRNVFTAIEGRGTPGGSGPYVAY